MEFNRDLRIMFTPEARAVLLQPNLTLTPHHQCCQLCVPGDLMQFPGCEAYFVVQSRKWIVSEASESLVVILVLLPDASPLRLVS